MHIPRAYTLNTGCGHFLCETITIRENKIRSSLGDEHSPPVGYFRSLTLFRNLDRYGSHRQIKFTLKENQMAGTKGRSGGQRTGAGRPAKPPALLTVADTSDPMQFMLSVMRDPTADARLRVDAAKALLPYLHRKKGEPGKKAAAADAAQKACSGKFAPGKSPTLATVTQFSGKHTTE